MEQISPLKEMSSNAREKKVAWEVRSLGGSHLADPPTTVHTVSYFLQDQNDADCRGVRVVKCNREDALDGLRVATHECPLVDVALRRSRSPRSLRKRAGRTSEGRRRNGGDRRPRTWAAKSRCYDKRV